MSVSRRKRPHLRRHSFHLSMRDWIFRSTLVLPLLACASLLLVIPKIWIVSPEGMQPAIRISLLDSLQARSLAKQAALLESQARHLTAIAAWNASIANHPFHSVTLRRILHAFPKMDVPQRGHVAKALWHARMLVAAEDSQTADLLLAVQCLLQMGGIIEAGALLEDCGGAMGAEECVMGAALCLLNDRRVPDPWMSGLMHTAADGDPFARWVLAAFQEAYPPGWQSGPRVSYWRCSVDISNERQGLWFLILKPHLDFWVACKGDDMGRFEATFQLLVRQGLVKAWHHILYWRRCLRAGKSEQVLHQMGEMQLHQLLNVPQILACAGIYLELDALDACRTLVASFLEIFPHGSELWLLRGDLALKEEAWFELRQHATRMRMQPLLRHLDGYAYFFEAEGLRQQGRLFAARPLFRAWIDSPVVLPALDRRITRYLRESGFHDLAMMRYRLLEPHYAEDLGFWQEVFDFAHDMGQTRYLETASHRLHVLSPRSAIYANNYAAVLLALREDPSRAIGLTFSLVQQFPTDLTSRINHVHALLQNGRMDDASAVLASMHPVSLPATHRSAFDLALFEFYYRQSRFEDALELADLMRLEVLLPPQQAWGREVIKRLDQRFNLKEPQ